MKRKWIICMLAAGGLLLAAGCVSTGQRAAVREGIIDNPTLGFSGFRFEIPSGFELYRPARKDADTYNELQQMAVDIYKLNADIHPCGSERFYEGFLLMSADTCFLLMTVENDRTAPADSRPPFGETALTHPLMPLYNLSASQQLEFGETSRMQAVWSRGHAYEGKGWIYPGPRRGRRLFHYESCRITGGGRDEYILTGFAFPEHAGALTPRMQEMIGGMKF